MKHISLAFAGVVAGSMALSAQAGTSPWWSETFSGYSYDIQTMTNTFTQGTWNMKPEDGSSLAAAYSNDCYSSYYGVEHPVPADVLVLNTEGQELTFAPTASTNDTSDVTVVDADVFFVGSDSEPTIVSNDVQFALFLKVSEDANPASNAVMVYVRDEGVTGWVALDGTSGVADKTWHHVQVKINYDTANGSVAHVYIDGAEKTPQAGYTIANGATSATGLNSVSFKGTGAVDNFIGSYEVADVIPEHTFTAEAYVDGAPAEFTIDDQVNIQAGTPISFEFPRTVGTKTITNIVVKALEIGSDVAYAVTDDGTDFTVTPALDVDTDSDPDYVYIPVSTDDAATTGEPQTYPALEVYYGDYTPAPETTGFAKYFADAVGDGSAANPWQIPSVAALQALQVAVATEPTLGASNYVQTADIDMSSAGAFAGIGAYAANPTGGTAFTGTYDGQGYKIMNIDFTQRNYGGVFNQVNGGTIKNLTVSNITCSAYSPSVNSGEFGFAIIGNAGNGATLTNIVAEGVFASASQPATHNIAGIVIRASAGANTLVKDCVNNATLYGAYTKAAGICALTQVQVAGGTVAFDSCVNNGAVVMDESKVVDPSKHAGQDGLAGIVGYVDCDTTVKDCGNSGSLSSDYASARIGQIVGYAYTKNASTVRSLTDLGGNFAPSNAKMVNTISSLANVTGFQYATVANDVATTISGNPAAGGNYLLEGNAAPVIELADGQSITFDTALGYTLTDTGITAATGCDLSSATEGTATTYTAAVPAPPTWDITFNDYDSTQLFVTNDVADNATGYGPASDPTRPSYTFVGWTNSVAGGPTYATANLPAATADATYTAVYEEEVAPVTPAVDIGGGLAGYTPAQGETVPPPVAMDNNGFNASFVAPVAGYYCLMTASTPSGDDADYAVDASTAEYAEAGALVTLTDSNTSATSKFYKIGYSATEIK